MKSVIVNDHKQLSLMVLLLISSCTVGPDYCKPPIDMPQAYKEAGTGIGWKKAEPKDDCDRGPWWEVFQDSDLTGLIKKIDVSNQNLKAVQAQYFQALAIVDEAFAGYFPLITATGSSFRQKNASTKSSLSKVSAGSSVSTSGSGAKPGTADIASLNGSWALDVWGSVRRLVESDEAGAQATAAQVASVRLLAQASLAQYYVQLRSLDEIGHLLKEAVQAYQTLLTITKNRYKMGTASELDILLAEQNLQNYQVLLLDNGINRGQFEHAIAVLVGQPPSTFSIPHKLGVMKVPEVPVELPSALLERRPDVAQAERTVAQENALIGVAIAGYFPALTLTGAMGGQNTSFGNLLNLSNQFWSYGGSIAQLLFDGGLTIAKVKAAQASHQQSVAAYRQTVLTAIQDVEDTMIAARLLSGELLIQEKTVVTTENIWKITMNKYRAGTAQLSDVLTSLTNVYTAKENAATTRQQNLTAVIGVIRALGGGWNGSTKDIGIEPKYEDD